LTLQEATKANTSVLLLPRDTTVPSGPWPPPWGSAITLRHTTPGRTVLDEGSARRRELYLTTHKTHKKKSHSLAGFEPAVPARRGRRPTSWTARPLGSAVVFHTDPEYSSPTARVGVIWGPEKLRVWFGSVLVTNSIQLQRQQLFSHCTS